MQVALSLGSNLGDRKYNLHRGLRALATVEGVRLDAWSSCYETEPIGNVDQPAFINMAAVVSTAIDPEVFLDNAQSIERDLGRTRVRRWEPRLIDIDIILWGDAVIESARLHVPHPAFRERAFVLDPLAEIAPGFIDPVTGKTVAELAAGDTRGHTEKLDKLDL